MSCVVVFGREPVPGRVKTRLAAGLGPERAAAVYAVLLDATLAVARRAAERVVLALAEPPSPGWVPAEPVELEVQVPGDLGRRMAAAFARRFAEGETRVVLVGSDCPALSAAHLRSAHAALDDVPVALGPAADGGYWLVAQRAPGVAGMFEGVPWSSPGTLAATRRRLGELDVAWRELPELSDLDTAEDLEAVLADLAVPAALRRRLERAAGRGGG